MMKIKMNEDSKSQEFCVSKEWVSILRTKQNKKTLLFSFLDLL